MSEAVLMPRDAAHRKRPVLPIAILLLVMSAVGFICSDSFRQRLTDAKLAEYLAPGATSLHTQHATEELSKRIEEEVNAVNEHKVRRLPAVQSFYPALIAVTDSTDMQKRMGAAWVMDYDATEPSFTAPLVKLLGDSEPYVARNAATALARRGNPLARPILLGMLQPFTITAPGAGAFQPKVRADDPVAAGHRLGFVTAGSVDTEIMAPLDGVILTIIAAGPVQPGVPVVVLSPSQSSAKNALVALALPGIGRPEDLKALDAFESKNKDIRPEVLDQLKFTRAALQSLPTGK